jgi:hypothetical protein
MNQISTTGFQFEFVPSLPLSSDIGHYNIAPGCRLEQIAYFSDTPAVLRIVSDRWQELDLIDRAALLAHEYTYLIERSFYGKGLEDFGLAPEKITSEIARHFVGQLFSTKKPRVKSEGLPKAGWIECSGFRERSSFFLYDNGSGGTDMLFGTIHGRSSPYRLSATLPNIRPRAFLASGQGNFNIDVPLTISDEDLPPEFVVHISRNGPETPKFQLLMKQSSHLIPVAAEVLAMCNE